MATASPTARALAECKKRGFIAQVVERRLPHAFITQDLFGCIDILAIDDNQGVLGIQVTSSSNMAARVTKIREKCWDKIGPFLERGNRLVVWGFSKRGKEGKRKVWTLREVEVA